MNFVQIVLILVVGSLIGAVCMASMTDTLAKSRAMQIMDKMINDKEIFLKMVRALKLKTVAGEHARIVLPDEEGVHPAFCDFDKADWRKRFEAGEMVLICKDCTEKFSPQDWALVEGKDNIRRAEVLH